MGGLGGGGWWFFCGFFFFGFVSEEVFAFILVLEHEYYKFFSYIDMHGE